MNFLFSRDPLGRSNVGFLQNVRVSRLNDLSLRCALEFVLAPSVIKLTGWLRCSFDPGCLFAREDVCHQCTQTFDSDLGAWPILAHVLCLFSLLENCCVVGGHLELLGVALKLGLLRSCVHMFSLGSDSVITI